MAIKKTKSVRKIHKDGTADGIIAKQKESLKKAGIKLPKHKSKDPFDYPVY